MIRRSGLIVGAVIAAAGLASPTLADVSFEILTISASVGGGDFESHTFTRPIDQPVNPVGDSWNIPSYEFANGAALLDAQVSFIADPEVQLGFNVRAGASNTVFSVNSILVTFPTAGNLMAVASAGITVTDFNAFGLPDGSVSFTGGFDGKSYEARINNNTFTFAELLPSASFGAGSWTSTDDSGVLAPVIGLSTATSISSHYLFSLSARDRAAGTSTFTIIPAPGAAALGLGGLLLATRRRSR